MIILAHSEFISPNCVGIVVKLPDSGLLHISDIFLIRNNLFIVAGDGGAWHDVMLPFVVEDLGEVLPKYDVPKVGLFVPLPLQLLPEPRSLSLNLFFLSCLLGGIAIGVAIVKSTTRLMCYNRASKLLIRFLRKNRTSPSQKSDQNNSLTRSNTFLPQINLMLSAQWPLTY